MPQMMPTRVSAVLLIALGFLIGVVSVVGCGGSDGGAFAAGGSTTVIHTKSLPGPVTWQDDFTFTATFTPSDPNTVVLAVEVVGEIVTGASGVVVSAVARHMFASADLGSQIIAVDNAVAPFSIVAPYELSVGTLPGPTFQVEVFMNASINGVNTTINALTIRLVTIEGVMVMDESPNIS